MTCEELLRAINQYIDGEIDPAICDHLKQHMDDCKPCKVVVDTLGMTVRLYQESKRVAEVALQPWLKQRIDTALQEKWKQVYGTPGHNNAD